MTMQQQMILDATDINPMKPYPGEKIMAYEKRMSVDKRIPKHKRRPPLPSRHVPADGGIVPVAYKDLTKKQRQILDNMPVGKFVRAVEALEGTKWRAQGGGHLHAFRALHKAGHVEKRAVKGPAKNHWKRITANNGTSK